MYCKNCGNALNVEDKICTNCGTPAGQGTSYCANCGTQATPGAAVCIACGQPLTSGVNVNPYGNPTSSGLKSKMAAGLLGIFLGGWGVHNFYLGYTTRGIIQIVLTLCSCGIGGIWGFIEGILILCGNINTDADGRPLGD